jgi:hypothetical protein
MGWDFGYSGDCPKCGASFHHVAEDRARMSAVWMRCPECRRVTFEHVDDGAVERFWRDPHPCAACGSARERWDPSRCPRCGEGEAGRFVRMAD